MITDEMVERVARAIEVKSGYVISQHHAKALARVALEAAYPLIAAQVLDKAAETAYAWSWCEAVAENISALKAIG